MAKVIIILEDNNQGLVNQTVSYEGGYDQASPAHQFSRIMLNVSKECVAAPKPMSFELVE